MFAQADANHDGKLQCEEFVPAMMRVLAEVKGKTKSTAKGSADGALTEPVDTAQDGAKGEADLAALAELTARLNGVAELLSSERGATAEELENGTQIAQEVAAIMRADGDEHWVQEAVKAEQLAVVLNAAAEAALNATAECGMALPEMEATEAQREDFNPPQLEVQAIAEPQIGSGRAKPEVAVEAPPLKVMVAAEPTISDCIQGTSEDFNSPPLEVAGGPTRGPTEAKLGIASLPDHLRPGYVAAPTKDISLLAAEEEQRREAAYLSKRNADYSEISGTATDTWELKPVQPTPVVLTQPAELELVDEPEEEQLDGPSMYRQYAKDTAAGGRAMAPEPEDKPAASKESPLPKLSELSPELIDRYLTELFAMADENKNGVLEKEEFVKVCS